MPIGGLNNAGFEIHDRIVVHHVMDFDGFAAYLTVFHVSLVGYRSIEHHRDDLPAVRAREEEFHALHNKAFYAASSKVGSFSLDAFPAANFETASGAVLTLGRTLLNASTANRRRASTSSAIPATISSPVNASNEDEKKNSLANILSYSSAILMPIVGSAGRPIALKG
jgi:hypothetical protein